MIEARKIHERKMQEDPEYAREYNALEEEFDGIRETIAAIQDSRNSKNAKTYSTPAELWRELDNDTEEPSMNNYHVNAAWDEDAKVWIGTSPDVPGLCIEADTLEELCDVAASMVPELLQANGLGHMEHTPIDVVATKRTYTGTAA